MTGRVAAFRELAAGATALALAVVLAVPLSLALTVSVDAQVATGTILGNVKDNSGSAVPGRIGDRHQPRHAVLAHRRRPRRTGQYALPLLPVGHYKVDVTLTGFKNFSQTGILLEVGRNARVDATIEPGQLQEVVSVIADAPLVETNTAALSRTVGQNEVLNLPLVNRDLYSLLRSPAASAATTTRTRSAAPSSSRRSTARRTPRSAASTSSSTAATTPPACAAPATRRRIRKRCRSSASSPTATPRSTAATRRASSTSSPSRGPTSSTARSSSSSATRA